MFVVYKKGELKQAARLDAQYGDVFTPCADIICKKKRVAEPEQRWRPAVS
jgi:hypothetical protein